MRPPFITGRSDTVIVPEQKSLPVSDAATVVWTLHRASDLAQCLLCPVGDRIEFHIRMTDEIVVSQHCSGPEHALFVANVWWSALIARGWTDDTGLAAPASSSAEANDVAARY